MSAPRGLPWCYCPGGPGRAGGERETSRSSPHGGDRRGVHGSTCRARRWRQGRQPLLRAHVPHHLPLAGTPSPTTGGDTCRRPGFSVGSR